LAWDPPSSRLAVVLAPEPTRNIAGSNNTATTIAPSLESQEVPLSVSTTVERWRLCVLIPVKEGTQCWQPTLPQPLPQSLGLTVRARSAVNINRVARSGKPCEETPGYATTEKETIHEISASPLVTLDWAWTGELLVSAGEGRCAVYSMALSENTVHSTGSSQLLDKETTTGAASLVWQSHHNPRLEDRSSGTDEDNSSCETNVPRLYAPGAKAAVALSTTSEQFKDAAVAGDDVSAADGTTVPLAEISPGAAAAVETPEADTRGRNSAQTATEDATTPTRAKSSVVGALSNDGALIVARDPNDARALRVWQRTERVPSDATGDGGGSGNRTCTDNPDDSSIATYPWTWTQVCVIVHSQTVLSARWRPSPPGVSYQTM